MNCIKLSLLAFVVDTFNCDASDQRFGLVSTQNGILCASFGEKYPSVGSPITIIEAQSPQYFFEGELDTVNESCKVLEKADVIGPYFTVKTSKKISGPFIGVAVFGRNFASVINDQVVLEPITPKGKIRFRLCASNEGLHFSSWLDLPLKDEELWRAYYYLGYDMEPSCEENYFKK